MAILTGDSAGLAAADRALGGALSVATGGVSDTVLSVFDAQGRILRLGRDLTAGLRGSLGSADRASRTERIAAAHTVLVVTAYFEALAEQELPFRMREVDLTGREQITVAGGDTGSPFVQTLLGTGVPLPAPHLPYELVQETLHAWYMRLSARLWRFLRGLELVDQLDAAQRESAGQIIARLPDPAVARYAELYAQLAQEVPEFGFWSGQIEHQATRVTVRNALTGIETALAGLTAASPLRHAAAALATGYQAALPRPILSEGQAPAGICLPTLGEGYVDPDFRVCEVLEGTHGPAEEAWWDSEPVRSDLTEYLAGVLTSVGSTNVPLVVLGQPGAGKSVLTKILAARLPAAGYLPVRIVLREVPADADIQDQIEHAVRAATGERVSWPELVRAAEGAVPVLLFDGFDELLQATGVNQSDFLVRVARFQEREADQGRPVFALVTSRTAVADRARYPEGAVALRLEPFRQQQIQRWLDLWNGLNEPYLTARGLLPLPAAVAVRHQVLASQPLLLMMLALYDVSENALQRVAAGDEPLGEAQLYEELLTSFAVREVGKSSGACTDRELARRAEQELQRLSLISFGMLNRRRQWITAAEAEQDLAVLLGRPEPVRDGFRAPLDQGEIALGRFFFVQRAQAMRDEQRLATYEFLHATFGEYLAARLAVHLLAGLLDQRPALSVGRTSVDDDLLYVLLSYAPLSSRQMLRFVGARIGKIAPEDRVRLGELLITVATDHRYRTEHRFADYRPAVRATSSRHGIYSANLLLVTLLVTGGLKASELFPDWTKPVGTWHRRVMLWRSALTEPEWTDFALALSIRSTWSGDRQELDIRPAQDLVDAPQPVDAYWLYERPPGSEDRGRRISWVRPYPDQIRHKLAVSGGTNDAMVLHAVDPVFNWLAPTVTAFVGTSKGVATSIANGLTSLWLASGLGASDDELAVLYDHCAELIESPNGLDDVSRDRVIRLVFRQLVTDAGRLPAAVVCNVLKAVDLGRHDTTSRELRARAALMALQAHGDDPVLQAFALESLNGLAFASPEGLLTLYSESAGSAPAQAVLADAVSHLLASLPADSWSAGFPEELLDQTLRLLDRQTAPPPDAP
ncbi:NACHT domain-containing protein [Streptomyces sp. NPDC020681]|uniref:NACHT domain-containing protein n=1 Tax=Streptomyces sp. NPDC020681 TaxID=3365083 RepID=UPI0037A5268E